MSKYLATLLLLLLSYVFIISGASKVGFGCAWDSNPQIVQHLPVDEKSQYLIILSHPAVIKYDNAVLDTLHIIARTELS